MKLKDLSKKVKKFISNNEFLIQLIIILIVVVIVSELSVSYYIHTIDKRNRGELDNQVHSSSQLIQESIVEKIYVVNTIETVLKLTDYDENHFIKWAPLVYHGEKNLASIQLAPKGIVKHIYPLEGNEKAIGHDLLKDSRRNEGAKIAIDTKKITFIGPITLIQNNKKAIICRKPIYGKKNEFWGFSIVVINIEDLCIDEIINTNKYYYRIIGNNPDNKNQPIVATNVKTKVKFNTEAVINVPNGQWILQIKRKHKINRNIIRLVFYIIVTVIVCLITLIMKKKHDHRRYILELNTRLEELVKIDDLTKCYNRRYFEHIINKKAIKLNDLKSFCIIMLDIDWFKKINDNYGHLVGDKILIQFARIIEKNIRQCDVLARWGGEEFILYLPNIDIHEAEYMAEKIRFKIQEGSFVKNISVTASFGVVEFDEGDTYNTLLKRADNAVYQAKDSGRNKVVVNKSI